MLSSLSTRYAFGRKKNGIPRGRVRKKVQTQLSMTIVAVKYPHVGDEEYGDFIPCQQS